MLTEIYKDERHEPITNKYNTEIYKDERHEPVTNKYNTKIYKDERHEPVTNKYVAGLKYDKVQLWVQFFKSKYYITVTLQIHK
jgi:hypothetical protein